jgi:segregation and condensation protein B
MHKLECLPEDEIIARIEAALYSAGRPLSIDELLRASGTNSKRKTLKVVKDLVKKTESVFKAIEITQLDDGSFVFQLKANYTPLIRRFAQRPIISMAALKTLSYIAYEQPINSKRLLDIRGSQVYSQLKELEHIDFIEYEKIGRLKFYRTTKKFQSYFGVSDLSSMKDKLMAIPNKNNKN